MPPNPTCARSHIWGFLTLTTCKASLERPELVAVHKPSRALSLPMERLVVLVADLGGIQQIGRSQEVQPSVEELGALSCPTSESGVRKVIIYLDSVLTLYR